MVTQNKVNYKLSFENSLKSYEYTPSSKKISYSDRKLATKLTDYLVEDLLLEVISSNEVKLRISAVRKLGEWGSGSHVLTVLSEIARQDTNLQLRDVAYHALNQIKNRLQSL